MRNTEKGLTLVEVLAGIVLLSMILLLATSVHLFAQKQVNTQEETIQVQSNERLALNRITGEIRKANSVATKDNVLTINGTEQYKLVGTTLIMKDGEELAGINGFTVKKYGNEIKLKIGHISEATIYIRE